MSGEVTNQMLEDELPQGWAKIPLAEIATNRSGNSKLIKGKLSSEPSLDSPYAGFSASGQDVWLRTFDYEGKAIIVSAVGARCGKAFEADGKWSAIANTHIVRPNLDLINPKLFWYLINDEKFWVKGGTAQPFVKINKTFERLFALPPFAEQKRIADKLEAVLGRVEACRTRLDRVPDLLKRFRQSVLAAATSGQLTEDWREENEANGDWEDVKLENVAKDFSYGSSAKSSPSGEVPVLRMGNIQDGRLDWDGLVYTSDKAEIAKYRLVKGDVLFNRTNSPELVGKTCVFDGKRDAVYAGYLIRVRCSPSLLPDFLNYCLNSPSGKDYCWQVKTDGVSQSNINAKKLAAFTFQLPPLPEQHEIVRRVEALFAMADRIEVRLSSAQRTVEHLTPAVLAKAFRGHLVPQDPNDEPAKQLLSRIKNQLSSQPKIKKSRRPRTGENLIVSNRMKTDQSKTVVEILNTAAEPLSTAQLFAQCGHPADADTKWVESFFVELRDALESGDFTKERTGDVDYFRRRAL